MKYLNINQLAMICRNEDALKRLKEKYSGEWVKAYCPKTESRPDKIKVKESVKKAREKGLTYIQLSIAYDISYDTVRRYCGKKK